MTDLAVFNPTPSTLRSVKVNVTRTAPGGAGAIGVPVATNGGVPRQIGLDRATLELAGFEAKVGQTLALPRRGAATIVAVGTGEPGELDVARLRDAAAAFARAAGKQAHLATSLAEVAGLDPAAAGRAVVEGILLAGYRYGALKKEAPSSALAEVTLIASADRATAVVTGAERGRTTAGAAQLARDLANTPPGHLTASRMADVAIAVGARAGLDVEVFDGDALAALGCGGLLGVNAGSAEPPRMIKLTYRPRRPRGHLALVGKGVMYDSGGISLKPTDPMHASMKMDMSGAAAVLSSMSALAAMGCRNQVTGYLMCTDNMPSGTAMKLGDVITIHGGTTVEIHNTDAEGRLILADGLTLALEEQPDAVVDIATLTGACLVALGPSVAGVFGTSQPFVDQIRAASESTDEPVWQLPLEKRYRKLLDSDVADVKNVGGPYGGAITAAVFLSEFVSDTPWAHLDIAGPMKVDADEAWRAKGATGFGTRLLIDLAVNFTPPTSSAS